LTIPAFVRIRRSNESEGGGVRERRNEQIERSTLHDDEVARCDELLYLVERVMGAGVRHRGI
jgi:hypothetical protein